MPKKLILNDLILSYPHLLTPRAPLNDGDPMFEASFILREGHPQLPELMEAVIEVAEERWGTKAKDMLRTGKLKGPLRSDEREGYPENSVYFGARSKTQPGMVSRYPDADGNPMKVENIAQEFYPGAVVNLSCRVFAYDYPMRKGISIGLNNLQKWEDGPRLDGRTAAVNEFEADPDAGVALMDSSGGTDTGESQQGSGQADAESMNALLGI